MDNNKIKLTIESDGVYVAITNSPQGKKVTRTDIISFIEAHGVQDVDLVAVNELFKSNDSIVKKKVSSNTVISQKDESLTIEVSRDKMSASISFVPPINNGALLTVDDVYKELSKNNISFGIEDGVIEKILPHKEYGVPYTIATGKTPVNGTDGYLEYHFDKDKKRSLKPKELEDGKVDFHSLDLIEVGEMGQVLVTAIPPVEGVDGSNVYGTVLPYKKGKPTPPLPVGKNVSIAPNGTSLIADSNGQIIYSGNKVSIWPVLEIKGNIDNSTGDINFNGSVVISGSVLSGFSVKADEDISIAGVVEGATINCGSNLLVSSGIQGRSKASVSAGKNITTKFIESAKVTAGGNIVSDCIMHSTVRCDGSIELIGRKGLIVGGKISAGENIRAKNIGSSWATITEIEVGVNLEKLNLYNESIEALKKMESELKKLESLFDSLYTAYQKQQLSDDKKNVLVKTLHSKKFLKQNIKTTEAQIAELLPYIDTKRGSVAVQDVIRHGVNVTIGNASLHLKDDIQHCKLFNTEGRVAITAYS